MFCAKEEFNWEDKINYTIIKGAVAKKVKKVQLFRQEHDSEIIEHNTIEGNEAEVEDI